MAKHTVKRAFTVSCVHCTREFITGSSIKAFCSPECRVRDIAAAFGDGCWDWPGSVNPQTGYGQLSAWVDGKRRLYTAHRTSYAAFIGPADGSVLHRCDNRRCFNPAHLFLGTQGDNVRDMWSKGRAAPPPNRWRA